MASVRFHRRLARGIVIATLPIAGVLSGWLVVERQRAPAGYLTSDPLTGDQHWLSSHYRSEELLCLLGCQELYSRCAP